MIKAAFLNAAARTAGTLLVMALAPPILRLAFKGSQILASRLRHGGIHACNATIRSARWVGGKLEEGE
jgi:hypothetical protein